jgi:hypothetical protein
MRQCAALTEQATRRRGQSHHFSTEWQRDGPDTRRILNKLVELSDDEQNLDVEALQEARPWLRGARGYRVR